MLTSIKWKFGVSIILQLFVHINFAAKFHKDGQGMLLTLDSLRKTKFTVVRNLGVIVLVLLKVIFFDSQTL